MAVDRCPLTLIAFNVYPTAEYYEVLYQVPNINASAFPKNV